MTFIYIGERRSWRAGAVCNTVAIVLSGSESHLPDQSKVARYGNIGSNPTACALRGVIV